MANTIEPNKWMYVVIQNPGPSETIVGQHDTDQDIMFIPVFEDRDVALQGITQLVKAPGQAFEIQAIIFEDLLNYAADSGYLLFVLDGRGNILSKIKPDGSKL